MLSIHFPSAQDGVTTPCEFDSAPRCYRTASTYRRRLVDRTRRRVSYQATECWKLASASAIAFYYTCRCDGPASRPSGLSMKLFLYGLSDALRICQMQYYDGGAIAVFVSSTVGQASRFNNTIQHHHHRHFFSSSSLSWKYSAIIAMEVVSSFNGIIMWCVSILTLSPPPPNYNRHNNNTTAHTTTHILAPTHLFISRLVVFSSPATSSSKVARKVDEDAIGATFHRRECSNNAEVAFWQGSLMMLRIT